MITALASSPCARGVVVHSGRVWGSSGEWGRIIHACTSGAQRYGVWTVTILSDRAENNNFTIDVAISTEYGYKVHGIENRSLAN